MREQECLTIFNDIADARSTYWHVGGAGSERHHVLQLRNSAKVTRAALFWECGLIVHLNG